MKRTAILVNANSGKSAAQRDLENWRSFLVSPLGGAWLATEEVHVLSNSSKEDIKTLVRSAASDDYVVVIFIGEGELRKDRLGFPEAFLFLNHSGAISERELNPRNDRCAIFIDHGLDGMPEESRVIAMLNLDETGLARARRLFDTEVARTEKGCVKVYPANFGCENQHKDSYSAMLIEKSDAWSKCNRGTLDLQNAISLTSEAFGRMALPSGPRYQGGRRLHHFPFAISTKD